MWRKGAGFWLGTILALAFMFFFFRGADLAEMARAVAGANYYLMAPAVAAYFIGVWLRTVRWSFFLAPLGSFSARRLFSPVVIGFTINNILPGKLGLVARAHMVGEREKISKVASGTSIIVDQLFDGVALLFFVVVVSLFVSLPGWARGIATVVSVFYFGLLGLLWLLVTFPEVARRIVNPVYRRLPPLWQSKTGSWVELCLLGLHTLRSPGRIAVVFLLSILVWLMESAMFYLIALAFDLNLSFYMVMLVVAIANMVLFIPSLPGGIGP
ncbi:MAG: lysylphosphatidylglycerol synthase transmembrane domain-containing protein, partial [Dehalococcoidia bacterium]